MLSDILNRFRQGNSTARSHMKNLIEMAAVDGNFDDVEFTLLKKIAKRNGISEGQITALKTKHGEVTFEVPADQREKFNQMYDLVHMMIVDQAVHEDEMKLCNLFAIKFGYKREVVKDLIDTIKANIKNGQGPDETLKRVEMMVA